ncbi:MAG: trans-sulfuration enzyme family protein [Gemmatimonadales bacterium]
MNPRRYGLSTTAIHGIPHRKPDWSPVSPPLMQSSTFTNPVGSTEEVIYSRYGNNPNQIAIAQRYALLEGADSAIFLASGMGATALAHLAVLRPGDHLISSEWIYGGTRRLFEDEFSRWGINVTFCRPDEPRQWRKAVKKSTRAIFIETPTNPLVQLIDLGPVAQVVKEFGLALLVDSTFGSPVNFRPLEHGADVVITSATKYLNGHSDVIAGAVAGATALVEEVTRLMRLWGQSLDPHSAWLIDRGLRTLSVRMERHNANGMAVATWAEKHKSVSRVHYPGLSSHPQHALAREVLHGFGGMVGLQIEGGAPAAERFLRRLRIVTHAPSLAGVESLVSEPRLTSHVALTSDQRAALGFPDGFVRLSCGLEDADDLIHDLDQALGGK